MKGKSKHSDRTRFIVSVLYASGRSTESEIAAAMKMTKGAVSGIINRAGGGKLRAWGRSDRQRWLDKVKATRPDGGAVEDRYFQAIDIEARRR